MSVLPLLPELTHTGSGNAHLRVFWSGAVAAWRNIREAVANIIEKTQSIAANSDFANCEDKRVVWPDVFLHGFKNKYRRWCGFTNRKERQLYKKQTSQTSGLSLGFEGVSQVRGQPRLSFSACSTSSTVFTVMKHYAGYVRPCISCWFSRAAETPPWQCLGTGQAPNSNGRQEQGLIQARFQKDAVILLQGMYDLRRI